MRFVIDAPHLLLDATIAKTIREAPANISHQGISGGLVGGGAVVVWVGGVGVGAVTVVKFIVISATGIRISLL
jgi:hypothetical protein